MNITEKTNDLIYTIEKSIADKEKQISELEWELKKEKAQLRNIKKVFEQNKKDEKVVS